MAYDPLGRLHATSASAYTQFAYSGEQLLTEYDGSSNLLRRYVPGPDAEDDPIVWYEGSDMSTRRWLLDDERGSVIAVTDSSGALVNGQANTYDEYGIPGGSNLARLPRRRAIEGQAT